MDSTERYSGTCMIAVPVSSGRLSDHFGHADQFALFEVDTSGRRIIGSRLLTPPPHEPGVLPGAGRRSLLGQRTRRRTAPARHRPRKRS